MAGYFATNAVIEVLESVVVYMFSHASCNSKDTMLLSIALEFGGDNVIMKLNVTSSMLNINGLEELRSIFSGRPILEPYKSDINIEVDGEAIEEPAKLEVSCLLPSVQNHLLSEVVPLLKRHIKLLYITHPGVIFKLWIYSPTSTPNAWEYPQEDQSLNENALIPNTVHVSSQCVIAGEAEHFFDIDSSPDASFKLRFQSGATYNLFTKYKCTDLEGQYSLSASVSLSPPVLPSNRRKGAKKKLLPADLCITEVKVITYGPQGLPLFSKAVSPTHLANSICDWENYNMSLEPYITDNLKPPLGTLFTVKQSDGENLEKRQLIVILFITAKDVECSSLDTDLRTVEIFRSNFNSILTNCSGRFRLATHSVLNRVLYNYQKYQEVSTTLNESLPTLSAAVTSIFKRSSNSYFTSKCLFLLELNSEHSKESEFSETLLSKLFHLSKKHTTMKKAHPCKVIKKEVTTKCLPVRASTSTDPPVSDGMDDLETQLPDDSHISKPCVRTYLSKHYACKQARREGPPLEPKRVNAAPHIIDFTSGDYRDDHDFNVLESLFTLEESFHPEEEPDKISMPLSVQSETSQSLLLPVVSPLSFSPRSTAGDKNDILRSDDDVQSEHSEWSCEDLMTTFSGISFDTTSEVKEDLESPSLSDIEWEVSAFQTTQSSSNLTQPETAGSPSLFRDVGSVAKEAIENIYMDTKDELRNDFDALKSIDSLFENINNQEQKDREIELNETQWKIEDNDFHW